VTGGLAAAPLRDAPPEREIVAEVRVAVAVQVEDEAPLRRDAPEHPRAEYVSPVRAAALTRNERERALLAQRAARGE
jgi:hypothetical protein